MVYIQQLMVSKPAVNGSNFMVSKQQLVLSKQQLMNSNKTTKMVHNSMNIRQIEKWNRSPTLE